MFFLKIHVKLDLQKTTYLWVLAFGGIWKQWARQSEPARSAQRAHEPKKTVVAVRQPCSSSCLWACLMDTSRVIPGFLTEVRSQSLMVSWNWRVKRSLRVFKLLDLHLTDLNSMGWLQVIDLNLSMDGFVKQCKYSSYVKHFLSPLLNRTAVQDIVENTGYWLTKLTE